MLIEQLHRRLDELTPLVRAQASEADRSMRMSDAVANVLKELGLFKLWVPKRYGGLELDLAQTLQIYAAAARIDGSFGWAVMIGAGGGLFAAYLEPHAAGQMFSRADAVIAGSGAADGRAERIANGYRVSGRWRYASGAHYATTFTANCIVTSGGSAVLDADGQPLIRAMSFAPSDVTIVPTWNPTGMRGTGSHDFEVRNVFVPEQHTFSVFTDMPRESGALYRLPFDVLTHLPVAAVGAGIARHALDAFAAMVAQKKSDSPLAKDPVISIEYAESHARWLNVDLALHALALRTWEVALIGRPLTERELAEIAACCTLYLSELQVAVGNLARLAGMTAILEDEDLSRTWRDLQTLAAHVSVSPRQLTRAGEILLASVDR